PAGRPAARRRDPGRHALVRRARRRAGATRWARRGSRQVRRNGAVPGTEPRATRAGGVAAGPGVGTAGGGRRRATGRAGCDPAGPAAYLGGAGRRAALQRRDRRGTHRYLPGTRTTVHYGWLHDPGYRRPA